MTNRALELHFCVSVKHPLVSGQVWREHDTMKDLLVFGLLFVGGGVRDSILGFFFRGLPRPSPTLK